MIQVAEILLVEDNPGDVVLTKKALKKAKISVSLHVVEDGEQALDFLYQRGPYVDSPRPDLMLLDLNIPKFSGPEVLATIKMDARLRRIPVVILTSSEAETDVAKSFDLHCQSYMTKPVDLKQFYELISTMEDWWFVLGKVPKA